MLAIAVALGFALTAAALPPQEFGPTQSPTQSPTQQTLAAAEHQFTSEIEFIADAEHQFTTAAAVAKEGSRPIPRPPSEFRAPDPTGPPPIFFPPDPASSKGRPTAAAAAAAAATATAIPITVVQATNVCPSANSSNGLARHVQYAATPTEP